MPPSVAEHSDLLWFILILLGIGFIGVLNWTAKGKLRDLHEGQQELKDNLSKSVVRIHRRIDGVDRTVNQLVGAHNVLHPSARPVACHAAEPDDEGGV